MAISISFNGVVYSVPETGDESWGESLTSYFVAIPQGALQKTGGTFTLTANVNFGANFGLLSKYYTTRTASAATAGQFRLARADVISWRNQADGANLDLGVNSSNQLTYNGSAIYTGGITALTGDVTATGPGSVAATVAFVGSYSAANVAAGATLANAAVSANTVSAIVRRDSSGNFIAGTITASLTGTASGNTTYTANNHGVVISGSANVMSVIAPDSSTTKVLVSGGASANPSWQDISTSALALASFGSTPSAQGASLSGGTLTLQPADGTHPGGVSILAQTFAGIKTFSSAPVMSALTASQVVVTDSGKALASLAYASANTVSTLVQRDGSGNFSAGTITASLTGTASGNTTISANQYGVVLSGAANVLQVLAPDSSATKVLKSGGASANPSWLSYDNANTVSTLVFRDSSGNFAAGTATLVGALISGLTASQAVVTDGSKNLASLQYTNSATASTIMSRDSSANVSANNHLEGYTTTATAAATTTLTVASTKQQYFTGSTTQTVTLPVASTLVLGQSFQFVNNSSGIVTIQSSGGNSVQAMAASSVATVTCILTSGTSAASWNVSYSTAAAGGGSVTSVAMTVPTALFATSPVTGSPVTTSGTLAPTLATQSANTVFAGPASGSAATPTFRAAVPLDIKIAINAKSADYTLTNTDQVVTFDATAGTKTATLPTAASLSGLTFTIKKIDSSTNTVVLATTSSQTIDGSATGVLTLATQNESITVCSDGTNWVILNHKCDTSWASYTPSFTGLGTVTAITANWRRVGDSIEVIALFTLGTVTAALGSISLPTGFSISTTKLASTASNAAGPIVGIYSDQGAANQNGWMIAGSATSATVVYTGGPQTQSNMILPTNGSTIFNSGVVTSVKFTVPIAGWFA